MLAPSDERHRCAIVMRSMTLQALLAVGLTANSHKALIAGAYGHSRIRHLIIGSTTTQMLGNFTIPILLFR